MTKGAEDVKVKVVKGEMVEEGMEDGEKYGEVRMGVWGYGVKLVKVRGEEEVEVMRGSLEERM